MRRIRERTLHLITSRYATAAAAVVLALTVVWGSGALIPPEIRKNPEALARFEGIMREIGSAYRDLKGLLEEAGRTGSKANEDARFVLPQATASNIVVTMNCRALLNFFEHRCCRRAQWEIRHVADEMLALCRDVLPEVFGLAGAKCERLRYCPEGEKFSCGRFPAKA